MGMTVLHIASPFAASFTASRDAEPPLAELDPIGTPRSAAAPDLASARAETSGLQHAVHMQLSRVDQGQGDLLVEQNTAGVAQAAYAQAALDEAGREDGANSHWL